MRAHYDDDSEAAYSDLSARHPIVTELRDVLEAQLSSSGGVIDGGRGMVGAGGDCLVLDEKAIEVCGLTMPSLLARVGNGCHSVVACRARKDQKAELLTLIRAHFPSAVTLAVGDGANDVAMIKAGHVGVGIIGKEGMQAVNSSDFAVGQFRFLRGLLLVHGRFINRRLSTLCFYMFYKNIVQTLVQFWFSSAAAWSGQTPYAQITINWFNMFYTSIPVIALAVNDMELPRYRGADGVEGVSSKPEIYAAALKSPYYTHVKFWLWQLEALYFSAVALGLPCLALKYGGDGDGADGATPGPFAIGLAAQNVVICAVTLRLVAEIHSFTILEHVAVWGSLAFWWANVAVFTHVPRLADTSYFGWGAWNDLQPFLLEPLSVLATALGVVAVLAPRALGKLHNLQQDSVLKKIIRSEEELRGYRELVEAAPAVATSSTRFALRRDETFSVDPRTASLSMSMAHALSTVGGRQVAAEYDNMGKLQDL